MLIIRCRDLSKILLEQENTVIPKILVKKISMLLTIMP